MKNEANEAGFDRTQLDQARTALRSLLERFAKEMRTTGKEMAVEFLCTGIEAIPVPVLNVALARSVRRMFEGSPGNPPAELQEVLDLLEEMQRSDEGFAQGIDRLQIDVAQIAADVRAIREEMTDQRQSRLELMGARTDVRWPITDNRISALLANTGGGSVVVDEITVHVESWEPEPTIDYSVPAAPLVELHLRAELTTRRQDYPLFELNGVGSRIFEERGAGAERIVIDLSSPENVRYRLRLHVPFLEVTSGKTGSLVWPPEGEPPVTLPFVCGPGWQRVEVEKLHAADALYRDMASTFSGLTEALAARPAGPHYDADFEARLERLRFPAYMAYGPIFGSFLQRFVPLFAELAPYDDRQSALSVVAALLAAAPEDSFVAVSADGGVPRALVELARGTPKEPAAVELASRLSDPAARESLSRDLTRR